MKNLHFIKYTGNIPFFSENSPENEEKYRNCFILVWGVLVAVIGFLGR